MTHKLKDNKQGFTIIEVLIVLAIAGLILLIVFLAVPALQRSQRNTGRKEDVGRIGTALNDYVSNNNGSLPTSNTNCTTIMGNAGTLNQYVASSNTTCTTLTAAIISSGITAANTYFYSGAITPALGAAASSNLNDALVMDVSATCGTTSGTTGAGLSTQAALLYTVETGSSYTWDCVGVQ